MFPKIKINSSQKRRKQAKRNIEDNNRTHRYTFIRKKKEVDTHFMAKSRGVVHKRFFKRELHNLNTCSFKAEARVGKTNWKSHEDINLKYIGALFFLSSAN